MLYQIHHQNIKTDEIEMVAQFDVKKGQKYKTIFEPIFRDVKESHPLSNREWQWLVCNEKSEHFVWAVRPTILKATG